MNEIRVDVNKLVAIPGGIAVTLFNAMKSATHTMPYGYIEEVVESLKLAMIAAQTTPPAQPAPVAPVEGDTGQQTAS